LAPALKILFKRHISKNEIPNQRSKYLKTISHIAQTLMKKFYFLLLIAILFIFPFNSFAKRNRSSNTDVQEHKGFVVLKLDNSKNGGQPIDAAYIILDKYNLTGAGYVSKKVGVTNNQIALKDLPEGKYYADIYTKGIFKQHFSKVIYVSKKGSTYTFKLEETDTYIPNKAYIPSESNDFSKTSVTLMK